MRQPLVAGYISFVAADPILDALWAKALRDWGEPSVHEAFITHCLSSEQLGEAASRYKAKVHPDGPDGDDEEQTVARKRLGAIATLAMARVQAESEETRRLEEQGPSRTFVNCLTIATIVGLIVAAASVLL